MRLSTIPGTASQNANPPPQSTANSASTNYFNQRSPSAAEIKGALLKNITGIFDDSKLLASCLMCGGLDILPTWSYAQSLSKYTQIDGIRGAVEELLSQKRYADATKFLILALSSTSNSSKTLQNNQASVSRLIQDVVEVLITARQYPSVHIVFKDLAKYIIGQGARTTCISNLINRVISDEKYHIALFLLREHCQSMDDKFKAPLIDKLINKIFTTSYFVDKCDWKTDSKTFTFVTDLSDYNNSSSHMPKNEFINMSDSQFSEGKIINTFATVLSNYVVPILASFSTTTPQLTTYAALQRATLCLFEHNKSHNHLVPQLIFALLDKDSQDQVMKKSTTQDVRSDTITTLGCSSTQPNIDVAVLMFLRQDIAFQTKIIDIIKSSQSPEQYFNFLQAIALRLLKDRPQCYVSQVISLLQILDEPAKKNITDKIRHDSQINQDFASYRVLELLKQTPSNLGEATPIFFEQLDPLHQDNIINNSNGQIPVEAYQKFIKYLALQLLGNPDIKNLDKAANIFIRLKQDQKKEVLKDMKGLLLLDEYQDFFSCIISHYFSLQLLNFKTSDVDIFKFIDFEHLRKILNNVDTRLNPPPAQALTDQATPAQPLAGVVIARTAIDETQRPSIEQYQTRLKMIFDKLLEDAKDIERSKLQTIFVRLSPADQTMILNNSLEDKLKEDLIKCRNNPGYFK